jgi:hypothetical protein
MWTEEQAGQIYVSLKPRGSVHRAKRFLEMLKTVDGIFLQRYSAVPEEKWTWRKFDMFTLRNISELIGDEFLDGELHETYVETTTKFTELKKCRKTFKDLSNRNVLEEVLFNEDESQERGVRAPEMA